MRLIRLGEVLREDYLDPLDMSTNALVNKIVREKRGIAADTALYP